MPRFRALYTRDVRKKRKVYHDGYLTHAAPGKPPVLTDEAGRELAVGERGVARIDPHGEGLELPGYLVDVDGVDDGETGEEGGVPAAAVAPPPPPPRLAAAAPRRAVVVPTAAAPPPSLPPSARPPAVTRTDDEILGLLAGRPPAPRAPPVPPRRGSGGAAAAPAAAPTSAWQPPRVDLTKARAASEAASAGPKRAAPLAPARQPAAASRWGGARGGRRRAAGDDEDDDPPAGGPGDGASLRAALAFPDARAAAAAPTRTVAIPATFASPAAYFTTLTAAVEEELNLRLHAAARAFRGLAAAATGRNAGRPPPPTALEAAARRARVEFYASAELQTSSGPSRVHADRPAPPGGGALFLTLHSGVLPAAAYRQGDLWVLGSDANLANPGPGPGDRSNAPWCAVAQSLWHGPTSDGRLRVALLTARPPSMRRVAPVCALRVGDAGTDLACLAALRGAAARAADGGAAAVLPALPALLGAPPPAPPPATGRVAADAAAHAAAARLNEDQAAAVDAVAAWVGAADAPAARPPAAVLIHGPFGCGKSSLLVAVASFLACKGGGEGGGAALPAAPPTADGDAAATPPPPLPPGAAARVLVVAHTNVAVDRVLVGLLRAGFTDVLRVGPVRRVDRALLPHSLHSPTAKRDDVAAELTAMVRDAPDAGARAAAAAELARVKAGALTRRRAALASAAVVGATAVSAGSLPTDTPPFDVVIVDEASQLTEPLALLALAAARPRLVVVAGDPAQLPPVVHPPAATSSRAPGLARSLLARLMEAGGAATLLRTQYRCHPSIARYANDAFYGGRLLDGVTAAARPALVPGLAPVALVAVPGGVASADGARSAFNEAEAAAVVRCVRALASAGVGADRVGVICFFRAQAGLITRLLARESGVGGDAAAAAAPPPPTLLPTVNTVDAFQGSEKDVILLSTVVTRPSPFSGDAARLCVALTRGRHHLVVVGHPAALAADGVLARVVAGAGGYRP